MIEPVVDTWCRFNILFICLTIFCVGYPIFYLLDRSNKNKTTNNKAVDKSFILFVLSFIPYLFLIYSCIFGIKFSLFSYKPIEYGFMAILAALFLGSIIPVYPTILIYQIIYIIKKYKYLTTGLKKITKSMIAVVIGLLLIPSSIYLITEKYNLSTTYDADKAIIEQYLIDEFGEQHYNSMEILKPDSISEEYQIKTHLLNDEFAVCLNDTRTEVERTTFYTKFSDENLLEEKLNEYLIDLYDIPENTKINTNIKSVNIKNYNKNQAVDLLLKDCDYTIATEGISFFRDSFDKQEIIQSIKDFYIKYDDMFKQHNPHNSLNFCIKINEQDYATVNTIKPFKNSSELILTFSGYNYGNGPTIDSDEILISLYE